MFHQKAGPVTYEVIIPGMRKQHKKFHINLLNEWVPRDQPAVVLLAREVEDEKGGEEHFFPTVKGPWVQVNISLFLSRRS